MVLLPNVDSPAKHVCLRLVGSSPRMARPFFMHEQGVPTILMRVSCSRPPRQLFGGWDLLVVCINNCAAAGVTLDVNHHGVSPEQKRGVDPGSWTLS